MTNAKELVKEFHHSHLMLLDPKCDTQRSVIRYQELCSSVVHKEVRLIDYRCSSITLSKYVMTCCHVTVSLTGP